jgi:predicted esterase YcpF (UPF0227 family)
MAAPSGSQWIKMRILYVHGFGSHYNPTHKKIIALETLGTVIGIDVDYCKGYEFVFEKVQAAVSIHEIDVIVGTCMGGYMAAQVGAKIKVPFVSLNPIVAPDIWLQQWIGAFADHNNNTKMLSDITVSGYPVMATEGHGLVLLDSNDEIINARETFRLLEDTFHVKLFEGGNHCFRHMEHALPLIAGHIKILTSNATYCVKNE